MDECIGERVNELRLSHLMSQSQLGDVLGLCTSSVSAKLRGKRVWTTRDLVRMSHFFGVSADFLLGLEVDSEHKKSLQLV